MDKSPPKKKRGLLKAISTAICILIALSLCAYIVVRHAKSVFNEGTREPEKVVVALSALPKDAGSAIAYLSKALSLTANSNAVATSVSTELSAGNVASDGGEGETGVINYFKNGVIDGISGYYPNRKGKFGDGFAGTPEISLNETDVSGSECMDGADKEEPDEYYYLALESEGAACPTEPSSPFYGTFRLGEAAGIIEKIKADFAETAEIKDADIVYDSFRIEAKAQKTSDRLEYIYFIRNGSAKLKTKFIGDYSSLKTGEITFDFTVKEKYEYSWAGISFVRDEMRISKGERNVAEIKAVVEDDATEKDYKISFESSDPSALSVDNEGNIKGLKLGAKPATVKVKFLYRGETYEDEILIYVVKSVKSIEVAPEKAKLKTGEALALKYEISPGDATIKSVKWYSEDENVARVGENGVVSAAGEGKTKIYAVSDDGYFRSSCAVTVTS